MTFLSTETNNPDSSHIISNYNNNIFKFKRLSGPKKMDKTKNKAYMKIKKHINKIEKGS